MRLAELRIPKCWSNYALPKLKLKKPEVGSRRGTVFVNAGKPNIVRGSLGNDFGGYALGIAIGMTIEYAISGKIYYYKNTL